MFQKTEKFTFTIPSIKIDKEIFDAIMELLKGQKTNCLLISETSEIETNDLKQFLSMRWSSKISLIRIETSDKNNKVSIKLDFDKSPNISSEVIVLGNDRIWVNGMGNQLKAIFQEHQLWYSPIAHHWQIRIMISLITISLIILQINLQLGKLTSEPILGLGESSFFIVSYLLSLWFLYPINRILLWLFPKFEFSDSICKKVRTVFFSLLVLLAGWIITEFLFPHLVF